MKSVNNIAVDDKLIILGRQGIHQTADLRKPPKVHTTVKISLCMKQTSKICLFILIRRLCCFCREDMTPQEKEQFWRKIQSIVEKDVVRTDRSHPYFRGEDNPNIEVLQ